MIIDLRSDTFTKPTNAMMEAMFRADVGDDVFGEDPTVNQLELEAARLFGMEGALFCPSGTMTNQIAIKCHTQPGDEVICDRLSHIYQYEGGGIAFNSGCSVQLPEGDRGRITAAQVEEAINHDDIHKANSRLVSIENTANRGGGSCYDFTELQAIRKVCDAHNLALHLDGARLWNALVAKGETPAQYGALFDSISICFSKGLGTPVGSVLLGKADFIRKARRIRKVLGGGMRQAGYLAAAALYALNHHIFRLEEDHRHASRIAKALLEKSFTGAMMPVETNIIIFEVQDNYTVETFVAHLRANNILCLPFVGKQVRMVTHLGITPAMVEQFEQIIDAM
jgi:threonine aldolase